jgi:vancomycin resistance protein VanJ
LSLSKFDLSLTMVSWAYLTLVALLWGTLELWGDRWWPATFLLFSPRWFAALPLVVLVPLAVWRGRYRLVPLLVGALIVAGPFMGFNLPLGKSSAGAAVVLRVLTCNIDNGNFNSRELASLIRDTGADIVALQECPRDINLGLKLLPDWHFFLDGELAVLSRYPLRGLKTVQALLPPHKWPRTCLLQCVARTPGGDLAFNAVHLTSPRYGLQAMLDRRTLLSPSRKGLLVEETDRRWRTAREVQRTVASLNLPTIVAGDFNMPVDSSIYRTVWGKYHNAFSAVGRGYGWTEKSTVRGVPVAVRIDHVLTGAGLTARICETCADVGSDHLPLLADIALAPGRHQH